MFRQLARMLWLRRFQSLRRTLTLTAALSLGWNAAQTAQAQVGSRGSDHGAVVCPGGCYGGAHPFGCRGYGGPGYYGFFRRYWSYGFYGPNYLYGPNDGINGFEPGYGLVYAIPPCARDAANSAIPPSAASGSSTSSANTNTPGTATTTPAASRADNTPLPENAARVLVIVPENAEVLFNGGKTAQTGTIREFVSPPLAPGKNFTYEMVVRRPDAGGGTMEEKRSLRVRANEQYRIDFTESLIRSEPRP